MNTGTKILAGVVVVVVIGFLIYWYERNPEPTPVTETPNTTDTNTNGTTSAPKETINPNTATPTTTSTSGKYKNGTYSAVGNYVSPGGKQAINVSVTLTNDKVSKLTLTEAAVDSTSKNYQSRFISGVQSLVVGTSLDAVKVTVVSGSSLTSAGFLDALAKIKLQATL